MRPDKIRFVKRSILFLIILVIMLFFLNSIYINVVQHKTIAYRKELAYRGDLNTFKNREIKFAFFGDSHATFAVNPLYINDSYHFGINHMNYIEADYKLKKLVEKDHLKIKNIVLQVDLHTFSGKFNEPQELFSNLEIADELASLRRISELREQPWWLMIQQRYVPVLGDGVTFVEHIISKPKLATLYFGWEKHSKDFSQVENKTKLADASYSVHFDKTQPRISELPFAHFLKLLKYAKDNDINVIFIKYPVTKEYDEMIASKNISQEDYYIEIFAEADNILGEEYVVVDYYDLFFDEPKYFNDDDHLNYVGAEIFSKKVYADFKRLNLTG